MPKLRMNRDKEVATFLAESFSQLEASLKANQNRCPVCNESGNYHATGCLMGLAFEVSRSVSKKEPYVPFIYKKNT